MPSLFEPMRLGGITLNNRIAVSPMCQYSAENGAANDWHLQHLGSLSVSGAGLVIVEQTAVEPAGRISHGCLGLYSDANEAGLARVVDFCRRAGWAALGIQLAHTGRKGSAKLPWEGGRPLVPEDGAWTTAAPSAVPFDNRWRAPGSARRSRNDPYSRRPRGSGKGARNGWASIWLNYWARTAFCCTASFRQSTIDAPIPTVEPRQPHGLPARSGRRDRRGLAAPEGARHAHHRHGLGRRRDHPR
ncbi:MAG: hypothetical protein WA709_36500 [Stellaceae bacterium]